jgi:hypothetical protein
MVNGECLKIRKKSSISISDSRFPIPEKEPNMERKDNETETHNSMETPGKGPDGVDKSPGEETSRDNINFVAESQKGKKVDGDPSEPSDQPDKQDL